jgi:Domain of unknown function (DUF4337)
MAEALEDAVESKDKKVALLIAILALFLALAEAGGKNAQHRSTEQNIEASDLFNFYQAKKIRQSIVQGDIETLQSNRAGASDPKVQEAMDKQIETWKATVENFDHDKKSPQDSLDKIQERAKEAQEGRELSNHKLEHYELASGLLQIAIVLASAAIITGIVLLMWLSVGLGLVGAVIMAFGFFAPTMLALLG